VNGPSGVLEGVWQRHRQWSIAASAGRARLDTFRRINLALLVVGAVFGAVAAQPGWPGGVTRGAAGVAFVALAVAGVLQQQFLNADQVARWTGARAASETLKAEVFRYRAGVAPYDEADRDRVLSDQVDAVHAKADKLVVDQQRTRADNRALPEVHDFDSYVERRAMEQLTWHRDRIDGHLKAAARIRYAEFAATAVAALLGGVAAFLDTKGLTLWIGAATTVGAAFAAHLSATQRDRIATGFAVTADRLDQLIRRLPANPDAATRASFVANVESTLAVQNESWVGLLS